MRLTMVKSGMMIKYQTIKLVNTIFIVKMSEGNQWEEAFRLPKSSSQGSQQALSGYKQRSFDPLAGSGRADQRNNMEMVNEGMQNGEISEEEVIFDEADMGEDVIEEEDQDNNPTEMLSLEERALRAKEKQLRLKERELRLRQLEYAQEQEKMELAKTLMNSYKRSEISPQHQQRVMDFSKGLIQMFMVNLQRKKLKKRTYVYLTAQKRQEIVGLIKQGKSVNQIHQITKISQSNIKNVKRNIK